MASQRKNKVSGLCFLLLTVMLGCNSLSAQSIYMSGPVTANVNDIDSYYLNDPYNELQSIYGWNADGVFQGASYGVSNVSVKWTTSGLQKYIGVSFEDYYYNSSTHYLYVEVTGASAPSNPGNPTVQSTAPGSVTLQRSGSPPSGVTWYWQSSSSGTSTSKGSGSTKTVTSGSTYYIRARNSSNTWSSGSGSVSYTVPPLPTWYYDGDGDGFGDPAITLQQATQPANYVSNNNDQCPGENGAVNGCDILSDENYVHTISYRVETITGNVDDDEKIESVTYFDGLGRVMQSIGIRAGGNSEDIITHIDYDGYGRQDKEYLPYADLGNDGLYSTTAYTDTDNFYDVSKYENTSNFYSEKHLEASPLGRVLEQGAPGADWAVNKTSDSDHTIKFDYQTNTFDVNNPTNPNNDNVKNYEVSLSFANNTYTPTLILNQMSNSGCYNAGELYKTVTKDENWVSGTNHTTEEFKDKQGRVILKRTYGDSDITGDGDTNDSGETNAKHDTYYVYDDYGNLTYVLPPKSEPQTGKPDTTELAELCYQYKYDHRNRLVEKKIPGKGWEYIVYDKLDRPIMTQDANLRGQYKWLYTKYDVFGRVAYTGIYADISITGRVNMQNHFNSQNNTASKQYENRAASNVDFVNTNYTCDNFPSSSEVLTINYYDNYTFDGFTNMPSSINGQTVVNYNNANGTQKLTKGLPTGSKVRVLDSNPVKWITTQTGYDEKGRAIYVKSVNDYLSTTDIVKSTLDFTGAVTKTETLHNKAQQDSFKDLVHVSVNVDEITKTTNSNAWNAGFATNSSFSGDVYIEFTVAQNNQRLMVGLSSDNSSASYNTIDFAIYSNNNSNYYIYESGSHIGNFGSYQVGDRFRAERIGSTIYYKKNGEIFYTSTVSSSGTLIGDCSIHDYQNKIKNLKIVDIETAINTTDIFTYDHVGRLVSQKQKINSLPEETIVQNTYDDLGQLASKGVGGKSTQGRLQNVDYAYNIRGWLKQINNPTSLGNDLFSFKLNYNTEDHGGTELFNGNISETEWRTANDDNSLKWYAYSYDALNRITDGTSDTSNRYGLNNVTYDKNGNIITLNRRGHKVTQPVSTNSSHFASNMDVLTYGYKNGGNQLDYVNDSGYDAYGFKEAVSTTNEYSYDANGNMLRDKNKGINTDIEYNHLNLPTKVYLPGGNISYIYDATGVKLEKKVIESNKPNKYTFYAGNYVYNRTYDTGNDVLKFFNHSEGYVDVNGSNYSYVYQYKDHLGNVRLSYKDDDAVTPVNIDDDFNSSTDGWSSPGSGSINNNNQKLNLSITNKWSSTQKNLSITPNVPLHIEFDFEKGDMVRTTLFVKERINGVWESNSNRNSYILQDGYFETDITLTGDYIKVYFEKGNESDDGTSTTCYVDNFKLTQNGLEILEENNYYPFGLKHKGYNDNPSAFANIALKRKFGGKEYQDELGLNWYDVTARNYDPALGRWMNLDPLAEKMRRHSPYNYAFNNPIFFIDPDGMAPQGPDDWIKNLETGEVKWYDASGDDAVKLAANKGIMAPLNEEDKAKYKNLGESFFGTKGENAIDEKQIEKQQDEYLTEVSSDLNETAKVDYNSDALGNGQHGDITKATLKSYFMGNSSKDNSGKESLAVGLVKDHVQGEVTDKIVERALSVTSKTAGTITAILSSTTLGDGSKHSSTRVNAVREFKTKVAPLLNIQTLNKISIHKY